MIISPEQAQRCLPDIATGVARYLEIMQQVHNTNVSSDRNFQRLYNAFYRMRQRPAEYYSSYFSFLEEKKHSRTDFSEILHHLHEKTGRVEASFASKMLATIHADKPVWDTIVMGHLGLRKPAQNVKDRIGKTVEVYGQIVDWYEQYLTTDNAQEIITVFDSIYPNIPVTSLKKVDLVLWSIRD